VLLRFPSSSAVWFIYFVVCGLATILVVRVSFYPMLRSSLLCFVNGTIEEILEALAEYFDKISEELLKKARDRLTDAWNNATGPWRVLPMTTAIAEGGNSRQRVNNMFMLMVTTNKNIWKKKYNNWKKHLKKEKTKKYKPPPLPHPQINDK